jgi:hypothetical protein
MAVLSVVMPVVVGIAASGAQTAVPASAGAPTAHRAPTLSVPYTMFTLANGLTVILHEDHSVPQVAVNVWYHVGSSREKPGRTGFAHLFEHILFEGSAHVKEGEFDTLLEAAGGSNNGSTTEDRTNYFETVPSNALDLALFLESDRMGYLLDVVTPALLDGQRDVVKNERRQSYENAPYGMAYIRLNELLYPPSSSSSRRTMRPRTPRSSSPATSIRWTRAAKWNIGFLMWSPVLASSRYRSRLPRLVASSKTG